MTKRAQDVPEGAVTEENLVNEEPTNEAPSGEEIEVDEDAETTADEVLAGKWGRGNRRNKKLEDAGKNVKAVLEAVRRRLND